MASIFTKIINGEIPCHKIAESENYFAFLDINPWEEGHTLVISKKEVDYIFDLDNETYEGLMAFSKKVAHAVEKAVPCKRVGILVEGLEVPHAHVHLIPIVKHFIPKQKPKYSQEELAEIAERIRENFE
tara:strand:+ start:321 stop:707 length:387 start_codon:yes stop_codon:yes gene_type:complete